MRPEELPNLALPEGDTEYRRHPQKNLGTRNIQIYPDRALI